MFYPKLVRSSNYKKKSNGGNYSDYKVHLEQVQQDCQFRCVYCDIKLDEAGFEGFHIDHFRPVFIFPDLRTDPENLVLACSKCNILKSKDWPSNSFDSIVGSVGYLDPFVESRPSYFHVSETGELMQTQDPITYMVDVLALNRFSRVQIRRSRQLDKRYEEILNRVHSLTVTLETSYKDGEDVAELVTTITKVHKHLKEF